MMCLKLPMLYFCTMLYGLSFDQLTLELLFNMSQENNIRRFQIALSLLAPATVCVSRKNERIYSLRGGLARRNNGEE